METLKSLNSKGAGVFIVIYFRNNSSMLYGTQYVVWFEVTEGGVGVLDKGVEPPKRDRSWLYGGEMLLYRCYY